MRDRSYGWLLLVLAAYGALAAWLPVADDELYYWCWAQSLQFSYYDHPPMVAYWIRLATDLFSNSAFALRLPACLATVSVLAAVMYLSRSRALLPLIVFTLPFTLGAVVITPDSPLLFFWAAYLVWLVEVHRRLTPVGNWCGSGGVREWGSGNASNDGSSTPPPPHPSTPLPVRSEDVEHQPIPWWLWLIGGVILGAGVLGKYTMALAVPAGFASFCWIAREWRRWMPGYVLHGIVALGVTTPILIYNAERNFAPLLFQWRHTLDAPTSAWQSLAEFIGMQVLLSGTLPFVLLPWILIRSPKFAQDPRLRVCACLYALPMTFFLYKATQASLEGNWAITSYVAFWPLAETWYERVKVHRIWRIATVAGFTIPEVAVLGLAAHLLLPLACIPIRGDRTTRQFEKTALMQHIAADLRARPEQLPVYTRTYQVTAQLRYHGLDARQIEGATRPSHFTQTPQFLADSDRAYVVTDRPLVPEFTARFSTPELLGTYPLVVRGLVVQTYEVWRYSKSPGPSPAAAVHPVRDS